MICERCQRTLHKNEGTSCSVCESKFHIKCLSNRSRNITECGDRGGYQWKCATCHSSVNKLQSESKEQLLNAISALSDKFELMFKIQLPKINGELTQLKCTTDRLVKQNEDILRQMEENEKRKFYDKRSCVSHSYRRRNVCFTPSQKQAIENTETVPILQTETKTARYRTRRQSYILSRMIHLLNRRHTRNFSPRKRRN